MGVLAYDLCGTVPVCIVPNRHAGITVRRERAEKEEGKGGKGRGGRGGTHWY